MVPRTPAGLQPGGSTFLSRTILPAIAHQTLGLLRSLQPGLIFSATIADLGYAGNLFVYIMDFETGELHEDGLVIPFGKGLQLPRNSTEGNSHFTDNKVNLDFQVSATQRKVSVNWPEFHAGRGIRADISLSCPPGYKSMAIVGVEIHLNMGKKMQGRSRFVCAEGI